jgi:GTP-binding protein EngB required for normal cell division
MYLSLAQGKPPSLIRPIPDMDNEGRDTLREELKEKCQRFRILIIGRANAGKSTILKRICDTTDEPEILDSKGNKVMAQ